MSDWVDDIDLSVWDTEPATVPESSFTQGADESWTAWNMWSAEEQVSDFATVLVDTLWPGTVLETGMGQGYSTRRLMEACARWGSSLTVHEAEDRLRDLTRPLFEANADRLTTDPTTSSIITLAPHKDPTPEEISQYDLLWLDSHWPERFQELRLWATHGKPGSYAFLHDANPHAHRQSGHFQLANVISKLGLPTMWFDNPRGSALLYKPDGYECELEHWPAIKKDPSEMGSVFIAQIDPGEVGGAYAHSMVKMMTYMMQYPGVIGGYQRRHGGPRVYASRDAMVRNFLNETDCEWMLQIDSDMVFHHTLLESLLSVADKDSRPIVAGHCYMNRGESGPLPTMWAERPDGRGPTDVIHQEGYPIGEMVEVAATGGACILIHRRVFETIYDTDPTYTFPWYEEAFIGDQPVGEDITFCIRARQHGFPIFVHTGLDIGHQKPVTINHDYFRDWRRVRRYVVASAPRSGTGYMAKLLQTVGVMCGHELVYNTGDPEWKMRWGDSSWMSVPHLEKFDGTVFHMVRHPLDTVSSIYRSHLFDPDTLIAENPDADLNRERLHQYMGFAVEHGLSKNEHSLTPLAKTIRFVVRWHQKIAASRPNLSFRVEDMNVELLAEIVRFCRPPNESYPSILQTAISETPTNYNSRPELGGSNLSWAELELADPEYTQILMKMGEDWGYDLEPPTS